MTKKPICFVPGRLSPFYFLNYWNNIPYYLREHGYEVVKFPLTLSLFFNREKVIKSFIEKQKQGLHFVFDDLVVHNILPLKTPHSHTFHVFEPARMNQPEPPALKLSSLPKKPKSFSDFVDLHIKNPVDQNDAYDNYLTSNQHSSPKWQTHKIPTSFKSKSFLRSIGINHQLFSPQILIGEGSQANQLSVEPEYLNTFNKIAERDWI